jgi:Flp pilus assembly protein TadG
MMIARLGSDSIRGFAMPASAMSSFARLLRRFRRNSKGATVVEFALVAPTFIALLFAILETALMFFANQVLETVAQDSARMIFTGQAQSQSFSQTQFANFVCSQVPALFNCNQIFIDVASYPSFSSPINLVNPIDANGNIITNMQYSPGGPGSIVVVRLFYQWQLFVTGLGYNISNMAGNKRLLVATAAFQNEPYLPSP